ncbi:MAG TPA: AEC family transporter [Solirubrobacteraceae bacterium]|nr:AEC family transporter [Solirubrobacteraceae bacterium]
MILVTLAIAVSVAAGLLAERRWGERAQAASRTSLTVLLWTVLPFVTFFTLARLEITAGVGAGLALGYLELAIVGAIAWVVATRVLGLSRPATGALLVVVVLANTGYLGVPLNGALLGRDDLAPAIAFDTVVSGPMFYVVGFAIGAVFGAAAGDTKRERFRAFLVRNPPLLAVVAALLAPDALAPDVLVDVATVLVYAVLPLGFFVLGVNLAAEAEEGALPFPPPFGAPVGVALALRLLAAPALMLAFSAAIVRLPDAYLLQAAMPSGINSLVVAHAYGLDLRITSAVLAWSTTIVVAVGLVAGAL